MQKVSAALELLQDEEEVAQAAEAAQAVEARYSEIPDESEPLT